MSITAATYPSCRRRKLRPIGLWLMLLAGFAGSQAMARNDAPVQSLEAIRAAAEAFVLGRLNGADKDTTATAGHIDPRLRLVDCEQPLEAFAAAGDRLRGNTSVGVQCPGGWRLYVPVKVETLRQVVTLKRPLNEGDRITAEDLELQRMDIGQMAQRFYSDRAAVIGNTLKRPVMGGTVLTPALVEEPPIIRRGQRVSLVSSGTGIAVRAPGEALADARAGQTVRVKNLSSGKIVEGVANRTGNVLVQ